MLKIYSLIMVLMLAIAAPCVAASLGGSSYANPTVGPGMDISVAYLLQARKYRDEGRYELSRQSYAQAMSTCKNNSNLEIIKRELAGVELLIRTMR